MRNNHLRGDGKLQLPLRFRHVKLAIFPEGNPQACRQ